MPPGNRRKRGHTEQREAGLIRSVGIRVRAPANQRHQNGGDSTEHNHGECARQCARQPGSAQRRQALKANQQRAVKQDHQRGRPLEMAKPAHPRRLALHLAAIERQAGVGNHHPQQPQRSAARVQQPRQQQQRPHREQRIRVSAGLIGLAEQRQQRAGGERGGEQRGLAGHRLDAAPPRGETKQQQQRLHHGKAREVPERIPVERDGEHQRGSEQRQPRCGKCAGENQRPAARRRGQIKCALRAEKIGGGDPARRYRVMQPIAPLPVIWVQLPFESGSHGHSPCGK